MSIVLPRLSRQSAFELIEQHRHSSLDVLDASLPDLSPQVTYSPVGGDRIDPGDLAALRGHLLALARHHGMPGSITDIARFEADAAQELHTRLEMTPHEASQDDAWSYLTCCWLLDIAFWRFGREASADRFVGHLNRNTFRRMWWRAEVLGPEVDLSRLGEDELVNIMERPTLFSDRRLARAIALEQIARVAAGLEVERMRLMREATKRLLRLTPFVSFAALADEDLSLVVSDAFDAAVSGLAGTPVRIPSRASARQAIASPDVIALPRLEIAVPSGEPPTSLVESARAVNFDDVAQAALDIARQTGRVTNIALREVVPMITADEARDVFRTLIERGDLVRRGVKRGTHYIVPEEAPPESSTAPREPEPSPGTELPRDNGLRPARTVAQPTPRRASDTALRRLLKRMR